jgi:hypothetical protein
MEEILKSKKPQNQYNERNEDLVLIKIKKSFLG